MAAFSYNSHSGEGYMNQYKKYLQNQSYVNQIDIAIRDTGEMNAAIVAIQTREVQNAIHVSSEKQREAIIQASDAICSTLESGFSDLNYNLEDIKSGIRDLSNLVGHGFSLIIEGQKITNQHLGNIQNLLRLPDSQKERVYHIEEGMKFLHNAFKQGADSDFYQDAFEEFNESKGGENKEVKDFISLYYIGLIHLKSLKPHLLNPLKAETCFRKAARYYLAEHSVGGTTFSNNLLQSNKKFIVGAAEAYLFAAEACYVQEKFSEAVELATEAWKILPEMTKAGFLQSKYLAANNQSADAARILEIVIKANRFLSMEVLPDLDLTSKPEIIHLLENLRIEAVQEAKAKYELCQKDILPDSTATSYLESIKELINLETFLDAKEASDLLLVSKKWKIDVGANFNSSRQVMAKISSQEFNGSIIDFVKFEREKILALPEANILILLEKLETQKGPIKEKLSDLEMAIDPLNTQINVLIFISFIGICIFTFPFLVKFEGHLLLYILAYILSIIWVILVIIQIEDTQIYSWLVLVLIITLGLIIFTPIDMRILAVGLIYIIGKIVSKSSKKSSLRSEVAIQQKRMEDLENNIKRLNNDLKRFQ